MLKLFEFSCGNCGASFEELAEDSVRDASCPECSGAAVRCPGGAGQLKFRLGKTLEKGNSLRKNPPPGMKLIK